MATLSLDLPAVLAPTGPRWVVEDPPQPGRGGRASEALARAVILRASGAAAPEPEDWRELLAGFLAAPGGGLPGVVCAGAKRLDALGRVFAMGEYVVHPKGFHHYGAGLEGRAMRFAEEVDAIAGGVMAVERRALAQAGGPAALEGELGVIELCLRLRAADGRVLAVPQVVVADATTPQPSAEVAAAFARRWGFDWQAADLEAVRARHAGSGLLWNARFHAPGMPFEKYRDRGALVWESYAKADVFRQRTHHLVNLVKQLCPPSAGAACGARLVDVGCGDGFFAHMYAAADIEVLGVDPEALGIEQARQMTASQAYPGLRPRFVVGRGDCLPVPSGAAQAVTLLDVIEHLPNPVATLREVARVLAPGGKFLCVTPAWQYGGSSDAIYHLTEYTMDELIRQVEAVGGLRVTQTGQIGGVYRDLVVVAQRAI